MSLRYYSYYSCNAPVHWPRPVDGAHRLFDVHSVPARGLAERIKRRGGLEGGAPLFVSPFQSGRSWDEAG